MGLADVQVVGARLRRLVAECGAEERDVRLFVGGDLGEAAARKGRETGVGESFGVILGECACVEGALEVLESERVIEDRRVWKGRVSLEEGCEMGKAAHRQ